MRYLTCLIISILFLYPIKAQVTDSGPVKAAAEWPERYMPLLKGKKVAIFANHTSLVGNKNLVDTLHSQGVDIRRIFGPEHGFRGTADAGAKVANEKDPATGIPIVSLYGKKRRPSAEDLRDVDILIFDVQDVGTRFYTYISSLEECMNACIEQKKTLMVLDRPNPNGYYVDGPVLDTAFRSFIGMQPIPVVHGMTMAEYAQYLLCEERTKPADPYKLVQVGLQPNPREKSLPAAHFKLTVITIPYYDHQFQYAVPVGPSPNMPDMSAILRYPSTCFFEGTALSEGRGTDKPFQLIGHPDLPKTMVSFTPRSKPGAMDPKLKDKRCYGWDLSGNWRQLYKSINRQLQLTWLLEAYRLFPDKDSFFINKGVTFNRLAGGATLREQIKAGLTEEEIRLSWQPALEAFKQIRKKYLLYPDFE
ncbi:MAG: DUF1343 domain-containing protein [Candidatus Pseudobacter hemicellulosilyticus]|uniref:DUF1343 domain-containing protein n=1 Tax=Candidatus Pseudobacter hemicellulosilyticus TaxID=3121375 RepID=A0AAJ5WRQ9_9BACT|nr:MAG: DUF1343 domain-containing protein [Pseudobacter sp.]